MHWQRSLKGLIFGGYKCNEVRGEKKEQDYKQHDGDVGNGNNSGR
jgi:hypothetical protein